MTDLLLPALIACCTSWLIVLGVRRYSARGALMDIPNERSSHSRATPRGGGLGIVLVTLVGVIAAFGLRADVLGYAIAGGLIAAVSWADDIRSLSNRERFGIHLLGAGLALASGWIEQVDLPGIGVLSLGWFGFPLSLLWLLGVTNIYNFMDGIDGIAGGQAIVTGAGWLLLGSAAGLPLVSWVAMLIAASSAGFLWHNWSPAKIFMGDVGSAFLGFTFAWLGIVATRAEPAFGLSMVLLLWLFLFDATLTLLRRLARGENIFTAHRSHLYQKLVIAGQPHARVSLLYIFLGGIGVLAAWQMQVGNAWVLALLPLLAFALWYWTTRLIVLESS